LSNISKSWSCPFGLDLGLGLVIKVLLTSLALMLTITFAL